MTSTPYALLVHLCGLSLREAADFHGVRLDTVKSWSAGRHPVPAGAIVELRGLVRAIDRAAAETLALVAEQRERGDADKPGSEPPVVYLGLASDDAEAQSLGWPCAGARAAVLARVVAGLPGDTAVRIVPRGSFAATAAALDATLKNR
ncbi:MAG: hypothetical protein M0006_02215 [Magnetospirillum sp.]|nr:hypothetical protein [Magnetospirillum sp.]